MQTYALQSLSDNAFRTLGLSGSATAREIEQAAHQLRDNPDVSHEQIDHALSQTGDARERLRQRALWYLSAVQASPAGHETDAAENDPIARHDQAIAALHAALAADPTAVDAQRWAHVLQSLNEAAVRVDLIEALWKIDSASMSQPRSTQADAAEAITRLPAVVADVLAAEAVALLKQDKVERAVQLGKLVCLAVDSDAARESILQAAEQRITDACRQTTGSLADRLQVLPDDIEQRESAYLANRLVASDMEDLYRDRIFPLLHLIAALCDDATRVGRARCGCEDALFTAARAWEMGLHYREAEAVLLTAITCCTPMANREAFVSALDRLRPGVAEARTRRRAVYEPDVTPWATTRFAPADPPPTAPAVAAPPALSPATVPSPPVARPVLPVVPATTSPAMPGRPAPVRVIPVEQPVVATDVPSDKFWKPYWIGERRKPSEFLVPAGFALAFAIFIGSIWYVINLQVERSRKANTNATTNNNARGKGADQNESPPAPSYGPDGHASTEVMERLRNGLSSAATRRAVGNQGPSGQMPARPPKPSADTLGLPPAPARIPPPPTSQAVLGPFESLGEFNREP